MTDSRKEELALAGMTGAGRPAVIGLAGGIGSGKSEAGRILGDLGCLVTRSDEVVGRILATDDDVRGVLVGWWGSVILDDEGRISRAAIAGIVFADADERRRLEGLLHPLVERERKESWARECLEAAEAGRAVVGLVIDAPLLFEAGLADACDAVIFLSANRANRLARVESARGWGVEELKRRENAQWDLERKQKRSDYVIENNGSRVELREKIKEVLSTIVASDTST